jgi:glycosyltransferase involved in cell wall biosynthesis
MAAVQPISATRVSVVVPVFNSESSLEELSRRIAQVMGSQGLRAWELILVNDGSEDRSWDRVVELSREHPQIRGIDLTRNWGQHNALLAGVHAARYEIVINLDDDLQNPPEEIPKLIRALGPDVDVVYGVPVAVQQAAYRRVGSRAVRATIRLLTRNSAVSVSTGFRAFRRELADELPETSGRRVALDSMLRKLTDRFGSVTVEHLARRSGRSNYSLARLFRLAYTEISVDVLPLGKAARPVSSYGIRAVTGSEPGDDGRG